MVNFMLSIIHHINMLIIDRLSSSVLILPLAGCLKASTIYIMLAFTFLFLTDLTERSVDRRLFEAGFLFPYNQDKDGNTLGNDLQ